MDQVSDPIDILVVLLVVACGAPGRTCRCSLLGGFLRSITHAPRDTLPCFHAKDVKERDRARKYCIDLT
jgi:hypothetical protein